MEILGFATGQISLPLTNLPPASQIHFRALAENAAGASWASQSLSLETLTVTAPEIENRSPSGITGTTATLRGTVTNDGNDPPVVTLYYGTTDGGTNPAAWQQAIALPPLSGDFSRFVTGLLPETTYHFRCHAQNAAGQAWAAETTTFQTTAALSSSVVIHEFHYNPSGNTSLEEFIELHNPGDAAIDLSGWSLSDAISFTFPAGSQIPAGGYLVIGEHPPTLLSLFQVQALGPWSGKLSSGGERIDLRNASGTLIDRVSYSAGFPWPTAADGGGSSAELIHPALDNDLAGSWRASGSTAQSPVTYIASQTTGWRYRKGTSEASSPVEAWRATGFNDSSWLTGQTGIGYEDPGVNTTLSDMRRTSRFGVVTNAGYASVYFRKSFTVPLGSIPKRLKLRVRIDDGCVVWINGTEVARLYVGSGQLAFNYLAPANHDNDNWDEIIIPDADAFLFGGTNVIAVHGFNTTLNSSDFSMDLELSNDVASGPQPTPGRANSSSLPLGQIPPQIRQVAHSPETPASNQPVTITARITDPDGMGPVSLAYQIVNPGAYIRRNDPAYATSWTTVPMNDAGLSGDVLAGDSVFTAVLPASLQTHRRLIRYRITFEDSLGNRQTVPYADDEQPNFAYFVYDGVPAWTGAIRPTSFNGFPATPTQTYPAELLESIPPFHLIAQAADVTNSQYNSSFRTTRFDGAVVERGKVYDHIQFRVRGIGSTYQAGKNKWNVYFNRSRDFQAHDNYGRPYKETWNNLLINANASPWASVHRGSAGIEEASSHRLYQLAGMAAMNTQYLHLRVIDDALEASPSSQYEGDLWGLYLGLEPTEGNFLDERGLPDGNLYSIEGNAGDKKRQGPPPAPADSSDWDAFRNALAQSGQTEQWYRDNVDLPSLYTFLAINRLIGNVDVRPGDNYRFYRRPTDNRWVIIPYDLDMMYIAAHHWGGSMDGVVVAGAPNVIRAISRHPALALEYRNRCREILSLIASDPGPGGGQIGQLLDEFASFVAPPHTTLHWANLDAAMWNLHPRTPGGGGNTGQSSHRGNFFRANYLDGGRGGLGGTSATGTWIRTLADPDNDGFSDHAGITQWMVDYATNTWPGGTWYRKAMTGIGTGTDSDPARQRGYGYQYLLFESQHGGWINSNTNPSTAPDTQEPAKPSLQAAGDSAFRVDDLQFTSSAFSDPQGPATFAARQWRIAEIQGPGIPGWQSASPRRYEIEATWESPEITSAETSFRFPTGIAVPGKTYRVRTRHKDNTGRWSLWSEPVQFTAGEPTPATLLHYWNFNPSATFLEPTLTVGGGALEPLATAPSEIIRHTSTDQGFAAANARNGDPAGAHLRVNLPLDAQLTFRLPTTGFEDPLLRYEARRSTQGAGLQEIAYSLDGTNFLPFDTRTIRDDAPVVESFDFRSLPGADNNPHFAVRITFAQGEGGTGGNNRIDNLTLEARALGGGEPRLLPAGNTAWNQAGNWAHATIPDGPQAPAIVGAPASANRTVTIDPAVTLGTLTFEQSDSPFRNRLSGSGLTFDGGNQDARLEVTGTGGGFVELDLSGNVQLASSLVLAVANIAADPTHGALRLRGLWSGPGGITKTGPGVASFTGEGKTFTGPLHIAEGVLQITQPATPSAASALHVSPGGQLRLISASEIPGQPRIHSLAATVHLAGTGRGAEIPEGEALGVLGALRYDPGSNDNHALLDAPVELTATADIHIDGTRNRLTLARPLHGSHTLIQSGGGTLHLAADSTAPCPPITVENGTLLLTAHHPASITLAAGTTLRGNGRANSLHGAGSIDAETNTLLAASSTASFLSATLASPSDPSLNGCLQLEAADPLPVPPAEIRLFLSHPAPAPGDRFTGGLRVPATFPLAQRLATTSVRILLPDPAGPILHAQQTWRDSTPEDLLSWEIIPAGSFQTLEILRSGTPATYAQWRSLAFPNAADRHDDSLSGPFANPSGDGIANLLRYAHHATPDQAVRPLLPQITPAPAFRFRFDPSLPDLAWRVTRSSNLSDWSTTVFDSRSDPPPALSPDGWAVIPLTPGTSPAFHRLEILLLPAD